MSTAIKPERLLHDLEALWTQMGKEEREGSDRSAGVLRACSMTLIVALEEGDDETQAGEAMANLFHEHPSRTIVLKLRKDSAAPIDSRVYAQCWMPFGRRQQICCEQIELSAGEASFGDTLSVLRGLIAPDLPVVLWCRTARIFEQPVFLDIANLAHKVILDSRTFADPLKTLAKVRDLIGQGKLYGDLTWTRLTRWRESVSRVFERWDCKMLLERIEAAQVAYTKEPAPIAALYLQAWLKTILHNSPVELTLQPADVSWQIRSLNFRTTDSCISIAREERGSVLMQVDNFQTRALFEVLSDAGLVREELAILGRDPIFERVLNQLLQP